MSQIIQQVEIFLARTLVDNPCSKVVLGVSGGVDSMALLHIMAQLQPKFGYALHVATFDHGWRGQESVQDTISVAMFSDSLGIPCTIGTAPVGVALSEDVARTLRHRFFEQVAHDVGSQMVALGHHRNDQAETFLLRLVRGAGGQGLQAMQEVAPLPTNPQIKIIRPLLGIMRVDLETYCQQHQLPIRHDSTNDDPTYRRNQLRLHILPQLRAMNPQLDHALARTAELLATEHDFLESHTHQLMQGALIVLPNGTLKFPLSVFDAQHLAIQRRLLRQMIHQYDPQAEVGFDRIQTALVYKKSPQHFGLIELGSGIYFQLTHTQLYVGRGNSLVEYPSPFLIACMSFELGMNIPFEENDTVWLLSDEEDPSHGVILSLPIDETVTIRTKREGDRWYPIELHGHSKPLKKWFSEQRIPIAWRALLPLIVINERIVGVIVDNQFIPAWVDQPTSINLHKVSLSWMDVSKR